MNILLLDSSVVIGLLESGLWETILKQYNVHLPKTIVGEVTHYRTNNGIVHVDLPTKYAGQFTEVTIDAADVALLNSGLRKYRIALHGGNWKPWLYSKKAKKIIYYVRTIMQRYKQLSCWI